MSRPRLQVKKRDRGVTVLAMIGAALMLAIICSFSLHSSPASASKFCDKRGGSDEQRRRCNVIYGDPPRRLASPPRPDPGGQLDPLLLEAFQRALPLWVRAKGLDIVPRSLVIGRGRFSGEVSAAFKYVGYDEPRVARGQIVDGALCIADAVMAAGTCDDLPPTRAEADRLYAMRTAERTQRNREVASVAAASQNRQSGAPLNAEDAACMQTLNESYQEYAQGECISGHYTQLSDGSPGPYVCNRHAGGMVTRTREYEKNICRRPIRFRDQCGSTIFGTYVVNPGMRFDRKFGYPCGRVY